MNNKQDSYYMARAIKVAKQGIYTTDPNPSIGCIIVRDGEILAEGYTQPAGGAHAEINALAKTKDVKGATVYVSLEPCSHHGRTGPCTDALIAAGISRVVIAMTDPNPLVAGQGIEKLTAAGIEVVIGVLQQEAEQFNKGFFKRMRQGLPWITSKLACSLDGRTALANGDSKWITSAAARADVHSLRAASSAILTGIGTVLADDPQLNARVDFACVQPIKVILDSKLRIPLTAKLLSAGQETWIMTCSQDRQKQQALQALGCQVFSLAADNNGQPDLAQVFRLLAEQQINSVWVEAGASLNAALIETGMVDEWLVYMAPCILGSQSMGMFNTPNLQSMSERKQLRLTNVRQVGSDLKLSYQAVQ